jgi:hypothetical protein
MSFTSDLKKVKNLDEAQYLFESEVNRISKLTVYSKSKSSYDNRVLKIQNDIYRHLDSLNIKGILYFYDYMQYENIAKSVNLSVDDNSFTKDDSIFFRRLWVFIFFYSICFILLMLYITHHVKPVDNTVSRETVKHTKSVANHDDKVIDDNNSVENDNEIVYNQYRGQNTTKKILKEDEAWANRRN